MLPAAKIDSFNRNTLKTAEMDLPQSLYPAYIRFVDTCIQSRSDRPDIDAIIETAHQLVPFTSLAIVLDNVEEFALHDRKQVILHNVDPAWPEIYFKRRFQEVDPVIHAVSETEDAVLWSQVYEQAENVQPDFQELSKRYIGGEGVSILHRGDPGFTLISMVITRKADMDLSLCLLERMAPHLHEVFSRPGEYQRRSLFKPQLSLRELEVLLALKEGSSNREVAQSLDISERTVKFHLSNIYQKLGVNKRSQAVATAGEFGLI